MSKHTLFVEKYRPDTLDGYIGNEHFIADLQKWITEGNLPNLLLHGSPGTGKTTAAKLIVKNIQCDFIYINCSDENGIDTIFIPRDRVGRPKKGPVSFFTQSGALGAVLMEFAASLPASVAIPSP